MRPVRTRKDMTNVNSKWSIVLIVISLAIAGLRIGGITHIAYQAAAHLFVGGMIGAAVALYRWTAYDAGRREFWFPIYLALFLSAVEVACFFAFRK